MSVMYILDSKDYLVSAIFLPKLIGCINISLANIDQNLSCFGIAIHATEMEWGLETFRIFGISQCTMLNINQFHLLYKQYKYTS